jgi:hypothetical protein
VTETEPDSYGLAENAYIQTAQADPELTGFYERSEDHLWAIGRALHGAGWLTPAEADRQRVVETEARLLLLKLDERWTGAAPVDFEPLMEALERALAAVRAPNSGGPVSPGEAVPTPEHVAPGDRRYDRIAEVVHDALFYEDNEDGPIFRWSERRLVSDDDGYLKLATDAVVRDLWINRAEIVRLLGGSSAVAEPRTPTDERAATEALHGIWSSSPDTCRFIEDRFPGLAHGIDRVTQFVDGSVAPEVVRGEAAEPDRTTSVADTTPASLTVPRELLESMHDPDPCWFDHHGGCQAHGYISLEPGEVCPQAQVGALLAGGDPR